MQARKNTRMNDAVKSTGGSSQSNPFLEFCNVIDLHPLYAAINRARELARANSCEPAGVAWDPAWPELEVGDDERWDDLIQANWDILSRWYAMCVQASRDGKRLNFKIVEGVETCAAIELVQPSASQLGRDIRVGRPAQYAGRGHSLRGRSGLKIRSRLIRRADHRPATRPKSSSSHTQGRGRLRHTASQGRTLRVGVARCDGSFASSSAWCTDDACADRHDESLESPCRARV
jgi:hypothetical protein